MERGSLEVPEDWSRSGSKKVTLPFVRLSRRAASGHLPVFLLHGGPGSSNLHVGHLATYLQKTRDVVLVGYRGADGETRFPFPKFRGTVNSFDFSRPESSFAKMAQAFEVDCERVEARGYSVRQYTIDNVIEDLEYFRASLGYQEINIIGGSYGTRLAFLWGLKYPGNISRSILVAANPVGRFVWEPVMIGSLWDKIGSLWRSDRNFEKRSEGLVEVIHEVLERLPKRWGWIRLEPAKIEFVTFFMLFDMENVGSIVDAYLRASRHDYSGLATLAVMYRIFNLVTPVIWGDMLLKGLSDFDPTRDCRKDMLAGSGSFNSYASYVYFGWFTRSKYLQPRGPSPQETSTVSSVETLIVSGSIDFSTPSDFATVEMLPRLANGKQVTLSEAGHLNLWMGKNESFRHLVVTFLDRGVVDVSHYRHTPVNFDAKLPLSRIGWFVQVASVAVVLTLFAIGLCALTKWAGVGH